QHALDAGLAEGAEPPAVGPAYAHRTGTQRQGLEYIGTAADAAVHHHRDAAAHGLDHLRQAFNGAAAGIGGTATMVRHDDAVGAVADGLTRIFGGLQAFDDDVHLRHVLHALDDF